MTSQDTLRIAFIGGGNMAGAVIGGLVAGGHPAALLRVVEPLAAQRERLAGRFPGIVLLEAMDDRLRDADMVLWAVKPQSFRDAASAAGDRLSGALQLSVMAGVRCAALSAASGSARVVRSMPNTPALIGRGIAGLYAMPQVSDADRAQVERVLAGTGRTLWVGREDDLDAVTALSGSGPAYVFYFVEAMMRAAAEMGLSEEQGKALALATFDGAAALAAQSDEPPAVLRERVTSKGGTTYAALQSMRADGVEAAIVRALKAAQQRAAELGREAG